MIEIIGLQKYYNKGKQNEIHVINDVTLEAPECGMCAIFGPSGCGKTTLLNVIGGLDNYESGVLRIDGMSMEEKTDLLRNRYIGFIFQNYNLNKDETVFENVADALLLCGMRDEAEIEKRVMAALANVGMDKFRKRFPDTLSGGQQQRVAIARAIVKNPRIILADEPTGNLDETNTILVMDILKEMSKDRLVLLVTHEENLVQYYCDTVIELKDGKIVSTKINESANGYSVRDKNDVYLGEYQEENIGNDDVNVRYYGDKPEEPLKLTVVNHNGRLLLRIDTPKVAVIDEFSELKLRDGVFTEKEQQIRQRQEFDMTDLPPFEGSDYGKLFDFKTSVKRGYQINFKSMMKQKGKKRLRRTLAMFAIVFVFMCAVFGTGIRSYLNIGSMYNHNIVYVFAANDSVGERIRAAAADPSSGIDYVTVRQLYVDGVTNEEVLEFSVSGFESYGLYDSGEYAGQPGYVSVNATVLPSKLASDAAVIVGSKDCIKDGRVIITKPLADKLLKDFPFDYVKTYDDLMGTSCQFGTLSRMRFMSLYQEARIGCVIESEECAVYIDELVHAAYAIYSDDNGLSNVYMAKDNYFGIQKGEIVFVRDIANESEDALDLAAKEVKVGDTIMLRGKSFRVAKVIDAIEPEPDYELLSEYDLLNNLHRYLNDDGSLDFERLGVTDPEDQEKITEYYRKVEETKKLLGEVRSHLVFEKIGHSYAHGGSFAVIGREDFIECSEQIGMTSGPFWESQSYSRAVSVGYLQSSYPLDVATSYKPYYALHASDIDAATRYVKEHFSDVAAPKVEFVNDFEMKAVYTPDDIRSLYFQEFRREIVPFCFYLFIIILFMSLCMYFIMKSMIMNRTKEIGIYRAIGATRKNVLFRFAVEAGVVATLSLIVGYVLGSIASWYIQSNTTMFYYPVWYALIILVFLYALGIFCGTIPVLMILRKTPSEILAKYDI